MASCRAQLFLQSVKTLIKVLEKIFIAGRIAIRQFSYSALAVLVFVFGPKDIFDISGG